MQLIATCAFGLEKLVKEELKRLGLPANIVEDGKVAFEGDATALVLANLALRCADRVHIKLGEFTAITFDELFDAISALPFETYIGPLDAFPVEAVSVRSVLHSEPAIQSIVKKAIVKRLQNAHNTSFLPENSSAIYKIFVRTNKDNFTISIDSSGDGLNKRGYREKAVLSPMKETLAAAMIELSNLTDTGTLVDLFCGSGTILIEAYLRAQNSYPGIMRNFAFHQWSWVDQAIIRNVYNEARKAKKESINLKLYGFDSDPYALQIASKNAKNAGIENLNLKRSDFRDLDFSKFENCTFICNPPYGQRMGEEQEVRALYKELGKKFSQTKNCSLFIITPHQDFPKLFGKKEDKNRKLFNGNIKCYLFFFYS